jgi:hypothetical protein
MGVFVFALPAIFTETAFLAGAVFGTTLLEVVLFAAGAAAALRASFFAAFLDLAQRACCAAAIFARASALKVRTALVLLGKLAPAGWPGFRFHVVLVPVNIARACCSREISASISKTIVFVSMNPPLSRITHKLCPTPALRELGH